MSHDPSDDTEDIDERLESQLRAANEAHDRGHIRTTVRLASEVRRLAKAERRLIPYIRANFLLTNTATAMLDPETGRQAAVEMIAVLESPEHARQIQPDYDQGDYDNMVSWYSSCAYDNLAKSTALAHGYNSEGVHGGIAEGIRICHRTGKLECVTCFREYATDVHRSADDLDMALHHARHVAARGNAREGFDRRWVGADDEGDLLLFLGRLEDAETACLQALDLVEPYHDPRQARLDSLSQLETIRLLRGEDVPPLDPEAEGGHIPEGENPGWFMRRDQVDAVRAACAGDYAKADTKLAPWDRRLLSQGCLDPWFEVRLRRIAVQKLAGRADVLDALARPLAEKARAARDWLTLRRLNRLLDPSEPASPVPTVAGPFEGPFAAARPAEAPVPIEVETPEPAPAEATSEVQAESAAPVPLLDLAELLESGHEDPEVRHTVRDRLLTLKPSDLPDTLDVARALHLLRFVTGDPDAVGAVWSWAEAIVAARPENAILLNLLATLGDVIRNVGEDDEEDDEESDTLSPVDDERLESLFRRSLDLDPDHAGNHARAGAFYLGESNLGEAERCLARAARLNRADGEVALRLAHIYQRTDRQRDALAVLDMALRHGADEPEVAWQAALGAHTLDQFEAMLTYLDRLEELRPGQPWASYYRASGLIALERPSEALEALDDEETRQEEGDGRLAIAVLRTCAVAAQGATERFRTLLDEVLTIRPADVTDLTRTGLIRLFERLWDASAPLLTQGTPDREKLIDRLLETGLAPNSLFDPIRKAGPKVEEINFYVCTIVQPLDGSWAGSWACLPGEEEWTSYRITWGVLARDEEDASRRALEWQTRSYPLGEPAEVGEIKLQGEGFTDAPGIVWQGYRGPGPDPETED